MAFGFLVSFALNAQADSVSPQETIPRKVLVLDFVNQAKDAKSDYLSVSVAEALLDPLKKTGKFYLLPRTGETPSPSGHSPLAGGEKKSSEANATEQSFSPPEQGGVAVTTGGDGRDGLESSSPTFDEATAIARAKAAGADVVVIGNFVSIENKVQIQTKAIDVHTGQIAVAKTTSGQLDATVFDLIQKLADDMSAAMAQALPPIPKQVVVTERVGFGLYAKDFELHAFTGTGLPLGKPNPYLNPGISGMADLQFEFLHKYFNPYFSFALTNASGNKNVENMLIFTALGGAAYTFALPWKVPYIEKLSVSPFFALGASFGTIRAAPDIEVQSFSYNVFTVSTGATLDAFLSDKWSVSLTLRGNYLAESQTPLPVIYILLGAGYRI
ncbi:MAG: hypothetical protein OHK0011_08770 [Turneriella sp.]